MLKIKGLINILWIMTILFWLHPIDSSFAGGCDDKGAGVGTSTLTGNYIYPPGYLCPENPSLVYDTANSAETIELNGSATLIVIGNNPPYTWSVSGTGFTLENEGQPTGPTNTLYADDTACGTATITVTGCGGPSVTGSVRSIAGHWEYNTECSLYSSLYIIETTIGGEYSKTWYWCPNNPGSCPSGINPASVNISYWLPGGGDCYFGEGCDPYCDLIPCALVTGNWVCN